MKVFTYTLYKEHCDLYTEIQGSIAVNSCHIELAQKDIILLSNFSIIVYNNGKLTGVENTKFISFNLSVVTYSIDNFNAKIKVAILQQRQNWKSPQIKDLRLVIPADYIFMLVYPTTILKRLLKSGQNYPLVHTKHPLIHHLLQNRYHCTVNKSTK